VPFCLRRDALDLTAEMRGGAVRLVDGGPHLSLLQSTGAGVIFDPLCPRQRKEG
jgi:hypothetical protein